MEETGTVFLEKKPSARPLGVQGFQKIHRPLFSSKKKTASITPVGRSGLSENPKAIFLKKKKNLSMPIVRSGPPGNKKRRFLEDGNLEHYFHAALHLVWMMLEGELSICLVAANKVTDPREESLAVDV